MAIMATTTRGARRTRNTKAEAPQAPVEPQVDTTPEGEPTNGAQDEAPKAPTTNNLRWTFQDKDAFEDGKNQMAPSPFGGSYAILGETGSWSARYTDPDGVETVLSENASFGKAYNASVKHHRALKEAANAAAQAS